MFRWASLLAFALAVGLTTRAAAAPRVGDQAPTLIATTLDGSTFDLGRLRGRVVLVNLWATWCPPCRAEMPALDTIYRRLHGQGLEMIGLSQDKPRDAAKVRQVMAAFSYPAATADHTRAAKLATNALPITYIVDRAGTVRAVVSGGPSLTEASLGVLLSPLLAQTQP